MECAFLASPARAGKDNRYLTMGQIGAWTSQLSQEKTPTAIHLCGRYSRKPQEFFEALPMSTRFDRLQWNIDPAHLKDAGIEEMILNQRGHGTVIVQIRDEESEKLLQRVRDGGVRSQPLFDASGGRGVPFETVQKPLDGPRTGKLTGYAGGITPETVSGVLERLEAELPKEQPVWIDMETGVRTDDWLDLDKVQEVLCRCYTFTREQKRP
jgi:phosphoribosylanthranilate isomerase